MALATTKFAFNIEYVPGKKNIIVDSGTRHIPETDWAINEEDPFELNSLFPSVVKHLYSTKDFDKINKLNLKVAEVNSQLTVKVGNQE